MVNRIEYHSILYLSWQSIKRNKFLWVLAFLAALGATSLVGADFKFTQTWFGYDFLYVPLLPDAPRIDWTPLFNLDTLARGLAVALVIGLWLIHFSAQAGLIYAGSCVGKGKSFTSRSLVTSGVRFGWKLLSLNLLLFGFFYLLAIIGSILFASDGPLDLAQLFRAEYWDAFLRSDSGSLLISSQQIVGCVLAPLNLSVTIFYPFAQCAVVIENKGPLDALRFGWQVLWDNVGRLVPLVLAIISAAIFLFVAAAAFGLLLEIVLKVLGLAGVENRRAVEITLVVLLAPVGCIATAFVTVAGTLVYAECSRFSRGERPVLSAGSGSPPSTPGTIPKA